MWILSWINANHGLHERTKSSVGQCVDARIYNHIDCNEAGCNHLNPRLLIFTPIGDQFYGKVREVGQKECSTKDYDGQIPFSVNPCFHHGRQFHCLVDQKGVACADDSAKW